MPSFTDGRTEAQRRHSFRATRGRAMLQHYIRQHLQDGRAPERAARELIADVLHVVHAAGYRHSITCATALGMATDEIEKAAGR